MAHHRENCAWNGIDLEMRSAEICNLLLLFCIALTGWLHSQFYQQHAVWHFSDYGTRNDR